MFPEGFFLVVFLFGIAYLVYPFLKKVVTPIFNKIEQVTDSLEEKGRKSLEQAIEKMERSIVALFKKKKK